MAFAHGDTAPRAVDTTGLPDLPEEMATENPWRNAEGDLLFKAVEIGGKGFNSNCARCHGLEAISGGLAPDLRFLEANDMGDEWFLDRIQNGYEQNGAVKMPPFKGILSQEAMWAIRTYIETRPDADAVTERASDITALRDRIKELPATASTDEVEVVAGELDKLGSTFEPLSGAPRTITPLQQAAHLLRTGVSHAPMAAEMVSGMLRN
jgi:cytochrome c-550 PedF